MEADNIYGIHLLISAIKYLDNSNAETTLSHERRNRAAVKEICKLLPQPVFDALLQDRKDFWE